MRPRLEYSLFIDRHGPIISAKRKRPWAGIHRASQACDPPVGVACGCERVRAYLSQLRNSDPYSSACRPNEVDGWTPCQRPYSSSPGPHLAARPQFSSSCLRLLSRPDPSTHTFRALTTLNRLVAPRSSSLQKKLSPAAFRVPVVRQANGCPGPATAGQTLALSGAWLTGQRPVRPASPCRPPRGPRWRWRCPALARGGRAPRRVGGSSPERQTSQHVPSCFSISEKHSLCKAGLTCSVVRCVG